MTQRELNIRPLSEGIGLGSLKSVTQQARVSRHLDAENTTSNKVNLRNSGTTSKINSQNIKNSDQEFSLQKQSNTQLDFMSNSNNEFDELPAIDTSTMRQAHAAYAPYSVATEIRSTNRYKWHVNAIRFLAGIGTDLFVAIFSALVIAWAGVLAWNAGESGSFDLAEAFFAVLAAIAGASMYQALIAIVLLSICWRFGKKFFSK